MDLMRIDGIEKECEGRNSKEDWKEKIKMERGKRTQVT